jgi:pilus assembly protein CpaB
MRIPNFQGLLQSNLLLGLAAVAAGLLAAWLGAQQLKQRAAALEQESKQRFATAPFVVASQDVAKGQQIDASLLSVRSMPRAYTPTDALAPDSAGMLIGGRAAIGIRRGTPVVMAALLREDSALRLSEQLPMGMRALTIQVDQLNALSGHLEAGDTVDLYYSRTQGAGAVLVPLMQRVRVLATGDITELQHRSQIGDSEPRDFSSVTLLVSGIDAQRIVLAEQTGRITLLLRRPTDESILDSRVFSSAQLLGDQSTRGVVRMDARVELLVGGTGGNPSRSWLQTGVRAHGGHGEGA